MTPERFRAQLTELTAALAGRPLDADLDTWLNREHGAGSDTFVFSTALAGANIDTLTDYAVIDDTLRLENTGTGLFNAVTVTGALAATAFATGATAGDASDRIIYDATTGALYYDADGVGGAAQVQFATLVSNATLGTHPGAGLTAADFFVVI